MKRTHETLTPDDLFVLLCGILARLGWALFFGVGLAIVVTSVAKAGERAGVRLYAWTPNADSPTFVIPVREGETPRAAAANYLASVRRSPELSKLFAAQGLPDLELTGFREIHAGAYAAQGVLLANRATDFNGRSTRIAKFTRSFARGGLTSYVIPISADIGLSESEARAFRSAVTDSFSLMVAMGGDDVDPSLYGRHNRKARNPTRVRDVSELELISDYVSKGRGFFFGTCRGQQLTAVALGYRLIQDLPSEVGAGVLHAKGRHPVEFMQTRYNFLLQASSGRKHVEINTLHHQAVLYKAGGPLAIAARASDGVIEALEFKNGRGLLVQFHPETMADTLGERILAQVAVARERAVQRACSASFL